MIAENSGTMNYMNQTFKNSILVEQYYTARSLKAEVSVTSAI